MQPPLGTKVNTGLLQSLPNHFPNMHKAHAESALQKGREGKFTGDYHTLHAHKFLL